MLRNNGLNYITNVLLLLLSNLLLFENLSLSNFKNRVIFFTTGYTFILKSQDDGDIFVLIVLFLNNN